MHCLLESWLNRSEGNLNIKNDWLLYATGVMCPIKRIYLKTPQETGWQPALEDLVRNIFGYYLIVDA